MTFTEEQLIARARFLIRRHENSLASQSDQGGVAMDLELARMALAGMEADQVRNPVLAYADSYRDMAKQGVESIPVWSVITDLERNIAPLYTAPQPLTTSERAELQEYRKAKPIGEVILVGPALMADFHDPVTPGDKLYASPQPAPVVLKYHQIRELVNELRDIAVEYHGTQQLRERIARTVRAAIKGADHG